MFDPAKCDPRRLEIIDRVSSKLLMQTDHLQAADLMVLGAHCRDLLHDSFGHDFALRATGDVDIAFAVAGWKAYREIVSGLDEVGDTGIRYRVDGVATDLVPFGPIEDPTGVVPDPNRNLSVWAFREVFNGADTLPLASAGSIRVPTAAGYCALKLTAWLDRSCGNDYKDASDIATVVYWYTSAQQVRDRLYETGEDGYAILKRFDFDESSSAAYLLGQDVATLIGSTRTDELQARWPGPRIEELLRRMDIPGTPPTWTPHLARRAALLNALQSGWSTGT